MRVDGCVSTLPTWSASRPDIARRRPSILLGQFRCTATANHEPDKLEWTRHYSLHHRTIAQSLGSLHCTALRAMPCSAATLQRCNDLGAADELPNVSTVGASWRRRSMRPPLCGGPHNRCSPAPPDRPESFLDTRARGGVGEASGETAPAPSRRVPADRRWPARPRPRFCPQGSSRCFRACRPPCHSSASFSGRLAPPYILWYTTTMY
jgi:hypothetical protein